MRLVLPALLLLGPACMPTFEDRPWLVDRARVLAVGSTPAEVRPGEALDLAALVATPDGPVASSADFALCTRPRTAEERTSVTASCLEGEDLQPVGPSTVMLSDACARFGPNPPPTEGDRPPQRPSDPDPTGGYAVPVRAAMPSLDAEAFGDVRIRCDLVGATRAIFDEFEARYTTNVSPPITRLAPCDGSDGPVQGSPGERVPVCLQPGADAAEIFVVYAEREVRLVDHRESLTVRWYTNAGQLDLGRETVEPEPSDPVPTLEVEWQLPDEPGVAYLWAVLSDDRGGVTWAELPVDVTP